MEILPIPGRDQNIGKLPFIEIGAPYVPLSQLPKYSSCSAVSVSISISIA